MVHRVENCTVVVDVDGGCGTPAIGRPREVSAVGLLALRGVGEQGSQSLLEEPDERLDLTGLPDDVRERLASMDRELGRVTELVLGPEVRTAARRLLVGAVVAQPSILRGVTSDEAMACAALTAVAKANDLVGQGRVVPVTLLRTLFNLRSAPNEKVQALTRAVAPQTAFLRGWERPVLDLPILGSPDFLVGTFRAAVITARDAALQLRAATADRVEPVAD